jgi:hypothetical protein
VYSFLNRYATPLTLGLFAVSAISGVALFFHVGQGLFHGMHEWLSIVLLLPLALHVWRNWGALLGYVRRRTLLLPVAATLLAAVLFAVPALSGGGLSGGGGMAPPARAVQLMTQMRLADLAPVLKTTPDALQTNLRQRGYTVNSVSDTLDTVASSSGGSAVQLLFQVLPAR